MLLYILYIHIVQYCYFVTVFPNATCFDEANNQQAFIQKLEIHGKNVILRDLTTGIKYKIQIVSTCNPVRTEQEVGGPRSWSRPVIML
jgi:hypothetical protein